MHTAMGPDVVRHVLHLILHLSEAQPEGVGYTWNSSEPHPPFANTLSLLGQGTLLDATKCGSGSEPTATPEYGITFRPMKLWQRSTPAYCRLHDRLTPP